MHDHSQKTIGGLALQADDDDAHLNRSSKNDTTLAAFTTRDKSVAITTEARILEQESRLTFSNTDPPTKLPICHSVSLKLARKLSLLLPFFRHKRRLVNEAPYQQLSTFVVAVLDLTWTQQKIRLMMTTKGSFFKLWSTITAAVASGADYETSYWFAFADDDDSNKLEQCLLRVVVTLLSGPKCTMAFDHIQWEDQIPSSTSRALCQNH